MVFTANWHRNSRRNKEVLFICPLSVVKGKFQGVGYSYWYCSEGRHVQVGGALETVELRF